jgi:hypothetical protein
MDEIGSVDRSTGQLSELGGDRFHCLEDGVEKVLVEQLSGTELQDICVDGPLNQGCTKSVGLFQGLVDGRCFAFTPELAVVTKLKSVEGEHRVELVSADAEDIRAIRVASGIHGSCDEHDDAVPSLVLVLEVDEGIEEPFPLGERWVGVLDPAVLQQVTDLRSSEPRVCVSQDAADRFQVLGGEWRNKVLGFDGHVYNSPRKAR